MDATSLQFITSALMKKVFFSSLKWTQFLAQSSKWWYLCISLFVNPVLKYNSTRCSTILSWTQTAAWSFFLLILRLNSPNILSLFCKSFLSVSFSLIRRRSQWPLSQECFKYLDMFLHVDQDCLSLSHTPNPSHRVPVYLAELSCQVCVCSCLIYPDSCRLEVL